MPRYPQAVGLRIPPYCVGGGGLPWEIVQQGISEAVSPTDSTAYSLTSPISLFAKAYDGGSVDVNGGWIYVLSDGVYLKFAPSSFNPNNYYDEGLIKTDASGNILWAKVYQIASAVQSSGAFFYDPTSGNFYLSDTSWRVYVTDSNGNLLQATDLGGSGNAGKILLTNDGLIVTGNSTFYDSIYRPTFIMLSSDLSSVLVGKVLFINDGNSSLNAVAEINGTYYLSGHVYDSSINRSILFLAQLNPDGTFTFIRKYYNSSPPDLRGSNIIDVGDGIVVTGGGSTGSYGATIVAKFDYSSNLVYGKLYDFGKTAFVNAVSNQLSVIVNGVLYIVGARYDGTNYHGVLMAVDPADGSLLWVKDYYTPGYDTYLYGIYPVSGGFYLAGQTYYNTGNINVLLMFVDQNGDGQFTNIQVTDITSQVQVIDVSPTAYDVDPATNVVDVSPTLSDITSQITVLDVTNQLTTITL